MPRVRKDNDARYTNAQAFEDFKDGDFASLDARVTVNEGDIATNTAAIGSNDTDIANLQSGKLDNVTDTLTGDLTVTGNVNAGDVPGFVTDAEAKSGIIAANSAQQTADLAVGWYTVATLNSGRATGTFMLRDTQSGRHQSCMFTASHHFSNGNQINVLSESRYATAAFTAIRIKSLGTYDGAALQVYVADAANNLLIAIKDNYQSPSWTLLESWVLDPADPGGVSTASNSTNGTTSAWSSFFVTAEISLNDCFNGMGTTGAMVVGEYLKVASTFNSGDGVLVGDDAKIVDVDSAHTLGVYSQTTATSGLIQYGVGGVVAGNVGIGNYGSFVIDGGAIGAWEGYSIGGRAVFMHNNASNSGIYNDVDNQWIIYATHNGAVDLRYAGTSKLATTSAGISVSGNIACGNDIDLTGTNPTVSLIDTNNNSAHIHCNSNLLYFLNGNGVGGTSWNTVNGYYAWYVNVTTNAHQFGGSIACQGNITAYSSDRRLKKNIKPIENALEKVKKLSGNTFDWVDDIEDKCFIPDFKTGDVGLIAQEVQAVLPQAAPFAPFDREPVFGEDGGATEETQSRTGENYLTVDEKKLVPLLVQAIKELSAEVEELKRPWWKRWFK